MKTPLQFVAPLNNFLTFSWICPLIAYVYVPSSRYLLQCETKPFKFQERTLESTGHIKQIFGFCFLISFRFFCFCFQHDI